ncbi:SPOR domain-containing protein [Tropicibacter sp. R15_0]|uniref:SPOR domain-containing protein n=1 Tax=Tropicibacter sp. R15_0 TaxID=2821101 RepID=UPI001ADA3CFF|nr:SPOR domain-containing protein [Tropicibacter sp. R15_0]MBO9464830.1 SPOR domain-containing protein [Tropicibacter sp. R15_0]
MADYTYDGAQYAAPASGKVANLATWMGAAASLALIVGVGVWGYKVMARDVSGVPIVQAMSGPMRVAPENPGGTLADHQGLAVNKVAGEGAAEAPAERLVLAPVPAGLASEDVAAGALAAQPAPMPMEASLAREAEIMEVEPSAELTQAAADLDPIQALANQLSAGAAPLTDLPAGQNNPVVTTTAEPPVSTIEQELAAARKTLPPGLERSLRPVLRPAGLRTAALGNAPVTTDAAPAATSATNATRELSSSALPAGTRLVQVGIFNNPESARKEWGRLDTRFGDFLAGKDRVIEKANRGGREFYRLRVHGFADLSDARRFCAAFMAQNVDCIPVVTK